MPPPNQIDNFMLKINISSRIASTSASHNLALPKATGAILHFSVIFLYSLRAQIAIRKNMMFKYLSQ
jgi:hypothetical protein